MRSKTHSLHQNLRFARKRWGTELGRATLESIRRYSKEFQFSIAAGDLLYLERGWYVTHTGLIRLATEIVARGFTSGGLQNLQILPMGV